ncbi:hypothetical protein [Halopelagius longus]|uniref:hypothetical protein n=1 Tax=Halopelagius longus TaxID=1236180 RepID=UPI001113E7BA|nr:hypothetical protein [Halopelagius longus]
MAPAGKVVKPSKIDLLAKRVGRVKRNELCETDERWKTRKRCEIDERSGTWKRCKREARRKQGDPTIGTNSGFRNRP